MSIRILPRLLVLPVLVSASILGFSHAASATSSSAAKNCKSTAGVNSIVYKVNGKVVNDLRGKVGQGSSLSIDFKIANGCSNVPVNISAYQAPSPIWDPSVADKQVLVGSAVGTYSADGKVHTLNIVAPSCYYQVDFGTGTPMTHITGSNNQSSMGDLISADNGGTKPCVSTTTTTVPKTTTTTAPCVTTTVPKATTTTVPHVTTTTVPQTTTTVPQTTTTVAQSTTTTVPQTTSTTVPQSTTTSTVVNSTTTEPQVTTTVPGVLAESLTRAPADQSLAFTGFDTTGLMVLGGILVLIGAGSLGAAKSANRRNA